MVIIRMTGGLGNQMFQYALYLKLLSLGKEVKMDEITEYEAENARPIMLWVFDLTYPDASRTEINQMTDGFLKLSHRVRRKLFGRKSREYHEKDCNFDGEVLTRDPAYLTGYFQSEKYFKDIEEQVRRSFVFSEQVQSRMEQGERDRLERYLMQIRDTRSVSIHVRRGDYLTTGEVFGGICTREYYIRAVQRILESIPDAVFFVFSNDTEWVEGQLPGLCRELEISEDRFIIAEGTTEDTGYVDMLLMSRCRHHILANSSFSWWGAWLNPAEDKLVIAPSRWFNNQECRDIYTEEMIRITPEGELEER